MKVVSFWIDVHPLYNDTGKLKLKLFGEAAYQRVVAEGKATYYVEEEKDAYEISE